MTLAQMLSLIKQHNQAQGGSKPEKRHGSIADLMALHARTPARPE
jgi:hypothetical protein